jgi:hypothetical protein
MEIKILKILKQQQQLAAYTNKTRESSHRKLKITKNIFSHLERKTKPEKIELEIKKKVVMCPHFHTAQDSNENKKLRNLLAERTEHQNEMAKKSKMERTIWKTKH